MRRRPILIRGSGDIGSAVAHVLFHAGFAVVLHDQPQPTTTRRKMAFTDAIFDGTAALDGLTATYLADAHDVLPILAQHTTIPILIADIQTVVSALQPVILIDARMRKRAIPEQQRELAPFTIGLGPNFRAGKTTDVVVETSWENLGASYTTGSALPLRGEPQPLDGQRRERYLYAPVAGVFSSAYQIGMPVCAGEPIAMIENVVLAAPLTGVVRGLTRSGVPVERGTKVIEIDPRGSRAEVTGLGTRPRRIAESVLGLVQTWAAAQVPSE